MISLIDGMYYQSFIGIEGDTSRQVYRVTLISCSEDMHCPHGGTCDGYDVAPIEWDDDLDQWVHAGD